MHLCLLCSGNHETNGSVTDRDENFIARENHVNDLLCSGNDSSEEEHDDWEGLGRGGSGACILLPGFVGLI